MCLQVYKWIIQMRIYSGLLLENRETKSQERQIRSDRKQKNGAVQRADTVQLNKWGHLANISQSKMNYLASIQSFHYAWLVVPSYNPHQEQRGQGSRLAVIMAQFAPAGIGCNYTNLDTKSIFLHSRPFKRYYIFLKKIISVRKQLLICYLQTCNVYVILWFALKAHQLSLFN